MLSKLYAKWMYSWETALTTRDTNRIVRPLEWGFDWLKDFSPPPPTPTRLRQTTRPHDRRQRRHRRPRRRVLRLPDPHRLPPRSPPPPALPHQRPPRNPRSRTPRSSCQAADRRTRRSRVPPLHLTRPHPLPRERHRQRPLVPGAHRKSKPASPNKPSSSCPSGTPTPSPTTPSAPSSTASASPPSASPSPTTTSAAPPSSSAPTTPSAPTSAAPSTPAARPSSTSAAASTGSSSRATSSSASSAPRLGSCYAFIAAAFDPRLQVCAFNHASTWFGDVVWTGQSTRHIRAAFEEAGLTQDQVREIFIGISAPCPTWTASPPTPSASLVVHATYDLTFLREYSFDVLRNFDRHNVDYVSKVLPCGHYTTGETPYKYIDGWYLGSFIYSAFKRLAERTTTVR